MTARLEVHRTHAFTGISSPSGFPILGFPAAGRTEMAWHLYQGCDTVEVVAPDELRQMIEGYRRSDFFPVLP